MTWSRFMSPFRKKAKPSLQDHFVEPSGIGSTFAAALASAAGLRLTRRRAGAGRFATAFLAGAAVVVVASAASALVLASMPERDRAPTTLAIRSLFISDSLSRFRLNVQSGLLQRYFVGGNDWLHSPVLRKHARRFRLSGPRSALFSLIYRQRLQLFDPAFLS